MNSFKLTEKEMNDLAEKYPTPFLVASLDKIAENYDFFQRKLWFFAEKSATGTGVFRHEGKSNRCDPAANGDAGIKL